MTARATVVIVHQTDAMRAVLEGFLAGSGFRVLGTARTAADAEAMVEMLHPALLIIGVDVPGDLAGTIAEVRRRRLADVIVLTPHINDGELIDAVVAGATGYLAEDALTDLPPALRGVLQGEAAIPRVLVRRLLDECRLREAESAHCRGGRASRFTEREWEVAELLRRGHDTREIAEVLVIEPVTVRSHVSSIMHKLGVSTRAEAMRALEPDAERVRAAG